jgi:hypothetical protein
MTTPGMLRLSRRVLCWRGRSQVPSSARLAIVSASGRVETRPAGFLPVQPGDLAAPSSIQEL